MSGLGTTILEAILALPSAACFIYVLFNLEQDKGAGHAVLGFLFPFYPFFWGWKSAGRLEMLDIMGFWTVTTIFLIGFPALMADASITSISIHRTAETRTGRDCRTALPGAIHVDGGRGLGDSALVATRVSLRGGRRPTCLSPAVRVWRAPPETRPTFPAPA